MLLGNVYVRLCFNYTYDLISFAEFESFSRCLCEIIQGLYKRLPNVLVCNLICYDLAYSFKYLFFCRSTVTKCTGKGL